jgi:hypothetical protein
VNDQEEQKRAEAQRLLELFGGAKGRRPETDRRIVIFLRIHFCASCRASAMGNGPYNGSHRRLPGGHCDSTRRMKFANLHQVIRGDARMSAFGTKRTSNWRSAMSAFGGKADIEI